MLITANRASRGPRTPQSYLQLVVEASSKWADGDRDLFREFFCQPINDAEMRQRHGWSTDELRAQRSRIARLCLLTVE